MSYRVEYASFGKKYPTKRKSSSKKGMIAAVLVLVLVFGAISVRLNALPWIKEYLLPGDPEVTAMALEGLVEDLKEGNSLGQAVTAFCKEIMDHGQ